MGCGSRAGKMEMHSAGKPQVEQEYCVGCGKCQRICAHDAPVITNGKATIDHNKCVGCGRCIGVCPKDAVMAAFDEANDVLNFKIAEYTKAVIQNRPNFHINMVVDKACADAVNKQPNVAGSILEKHGHSHNDHFKDVSPETNWISVLEHGEKIGIGTMDYELEKL